MTICGAAGRPNCGFLRPPLPAHIRREGREDQLAAGPNCGFLRHHLPEVEHHPTTSTSTRPEHPLTKTRRVRSVVSHDIYPRLNIITHPHPHPQRGRKTTCGGEGIGGHVPSAHTSFRSLFHTLHRLSSSKTNSMLPLAIKSQSNIQTPTTTGAERLALSRVAKAISSKIF